ncbi:MAG: hypothetical protein GX359_11815 [Clostridiales bacterium]|nr:hypothetical protein [Clostridiales bacterium]
MEGILQACEKTQDSLIKFFWDDQDGVFVNHYPVRENENWVYWWHAHALDCLLDGYSRTKDPKYLERFQKEYEGTYKYNGDTFIHNWYDDMEWMALALLRAWDETKEVRYKEQVFLLWEDIKTAWNDHQGGGLAWKKDQLDYKNTPANAPAAILAFRLYQRFHRDEDYQWGKKILDWNITYLMDPETSFIWDGINRQGDNKIDYDWKYTYNEGVVIGALVELYKIDKKEEYIDLAIRIARITKKLIADPHDGILPYEGIDDCGLFKGIFVRYLYDLIQIKTELSDLKEWLLHNDKTLLEKGINKDDLVGGDWTIKEDGCVDLAQHLSGIMLLEMAAKLI